MSNPRRGPSVRATGLRSARATWWSAATAVVFIALLFWYLVYTRGIARQAQESAERLAQIFVEVQAGLTSDAEIQALFNLQTIVRESGLPLVLMGPGDSIQAVVNLPFDADPNSEEGRRRIHDYVREMDSRNPPVGDTAFQQIHYGETREVRDLRWIPVFQVVGLVLIVIVGFVLVSVQRKAESERTWTAMARELAHQLGTPLSSLAGWLEALSMRPSERPGQLRNSEITAAIGEDLVRLEHVSHRFELIGSTPVLEPISIPGMIKELERYLASRIPHLGRGRVDLVLDLPPRLPKIRGSKVLLVWALENVVKNALDALAGKGGRISIHAREQGDKWVSIRIRDTGHGVSEDVRKRIFDPGVTTKKGGWGVGLALSRRIIRGVHKGRIELLEGFAGTTFQISLPIDREAEN